jgi:iron complex transport system substrate-binding protein
MKYLPDTYIPYPTTPADSSTKVWQSWLMRYKAMPAVIWAISLVFVSVLSGCSSKSAAVEQIDRVESISITSTQVAGFSRVIALANGSAEIIAALGHKDILIGRDVASDLPALKSVEVVTSGHQIVAEKILSLNPDLVLVDASSGPASALQVIEAAGIPIVNISEAWTLAEIDRKVKAIAQAIGAVTDGENLVTALENSANAIKQIPTGKTIAFLYLRGGSAIYLIGGKGSGTDSLIAAIGGADAGAQKFDNPFTPMTAEAIATLNPDVFLVMSKGLESVGGVDGLIQLPGIAQTSAGKNRAIVAVDDSLLLSFGPRSYSLLAALSQSIGRVLS